MTSLKLDLSWVARRLSLPEAADSRAQMLERIPGSHAATGWHYSVRTRDCDRIAAERAG